MSSVIKRTEIGVSVADSYWKVLKIVEGRDDLYIIFAIPNVGLHLSVHKGENDVNYRIYAHLKSAKLGIKEEINTRFFSKSFLNEWINKFLNSFQVQKLLGNEKVTIFPQSFLSSSCQGFENESNKSIIDLGNLLNGTFYLTCKQKIPLLRRQLWRRNVISDSDLLLGVSESGEAYLIFDPQYVVSFRCTSLLENLDTRINDVIGDPLQRAFEAVVQKCPIALKEWWSPNFCQNIQNVCKTARLKAVNF